MSVSSLQAFPFADLGLARRLERVEAISASRFVEARASARVRAAGRSANAERHGFRIAYTRVKWRR